MNRALLAASGIEAFFLLMLMGYGPLYLHQQWNRPLFPRPKTGETRRKGSTMHVEVFHGAGIGIHKDTAVATIRHQAPDQLTPVRQETRTFGTLTADLQALRAWLLEEDITHVCMGPALERLIANPTGALLP